MTGRERARANAFALRANGLSIRQVAERLDAPRSTVAGWLRGRGEWYELRDCKLCGEPFVMASGAQQFCTNAHAQKYRRYEEWRALTAYRDRVHALEAELAQLRAQLGQREAA